MINICYVSQFFFTKYVWIKPLKDKKVTTFLNDLIEIVNKSNHKPKTIIG